MQEITKKKLLLYYSRPGSEMTHNLAQKLSSDFEVLRIPSNIKEAGELSVTEPFVLITPTYENTGAHGRVTSYVPKQVEAFLAHNQSPMLGVVGCGNRNYLDDFAKAGNDVADRFGVPLLYKVEYAGTEEDIQILKRGLKLLWIHN